MAQPNIINGLLYRHPDLPVWAEWVVVFKSGFCRGTETLDEAIEVWNRLPDSANAIMRVGKAEHMVASGTVKTRKIKRQQ